MRNRIIAAIDASAFKYPLNLFHVFHAGSALHGASLPGKSDLDIYGLFFEPNTSIYGLEKYEHYVYSSSGDHERNTPDDIDITFYSLRRWVKLAAAGNPTALQFFFAPNIMPARCSCFWTRISEDLREAVVSRRAVNSFRGFVSNQMKRLLGEKGEGKHGQRPDLEATHGYDTKAAMHAVRLVTEGIELMQTGRITYPRPEVEYLRQVRRGEFSLDRINSVVSSSLIALEDAEQKSKLRDVPDFKRIDEVLVNAYETFYQGR